MNGYRTTNGSQAMNGYHTNQQRRWLGQAYPSVDLATITGVQQALNDTGDPALAVPVTGVWDAATGAAVSLLQQKFGVAPSGVFDAATRAAFLPSLTAGGGITVLNGTSTATVGPTGVTPSKQTTILYVAGGVAAAALVGTLIYMSMKKKPAARRQLRRA